MRPHKHNSKINREKERLVSEIKTTINSLESATSRFDNLTEPDLIDCTIFELNAIQTKYNFLLNKIKELEEAIS